MTKRFGRVVIAEDLSLAVGPGDVVGIVGPNGAGKTSLFGLISGDLAPGAGEVRFGGRTVTKLDAAARCRLGVGRTYQVPRPFGDMTVFENLLVAAQQGGGLRRRASYAAAVEALERTRHVRPGERARRAARPAAAQAAGTRPRPGHAAHAAAARRGGGRPHRPRGRPAGRDRPRRQRRGHRGDLDRARGARAHRRGEPADLPGRRQVRRRRRACHGAGRARGPRGLPRHRGHRGAGRRVPGGTPGSARRMGRSAGNGASRDRIGKRRTGGERDAAAGGPRPGRAPRAAPGPGRDLAAGVPRRGLRDHRRERRGQVDAAAHDRRPAPPDDGLGPVRRQGRDRAAARAPGHAGDRHGAGGQAAVRVAVRRGKPAGRRHVRAAGPVDDRAGLRDVRLDARAPQPAHRPAFRRRAADGRHRPGAGRQPPRAAARRAVARPGARGRPAHLRHAAADPGDRPHRAARRAGREPGPAGGVAHPLPAGGPDHPGRQARRRHRGPGRGGLLRAGGRRLRPARPGEGSEP